MERYQRIMIGHALLVMVVALFAGFMLGFGLIGGLELAPGHIVSMPYYGTTEGWARAHTGGITNGLMVLGVALVLPLVGLGPRMQAFTAYGLVFVGWANTAFYWFGNAAGSRALTLGDNPLGASNLLGGIGFSLAFIGALLTPVLLVYAAVRLLRKSS